VPGVGSAPRPVETAAKTPSLDAKLEEQLED
jgi:hypothetical protein